jgi:predicted PurR-regulated permease PerM
MTKRLVLYAVAVMSTLLALVVLWQFRIAVVYVLISLTLAAVLRPLFSRLQGKRLVVRIAWILFYLVVLASFVFFLFVIGNTAMDEIQQLAHNVSVQDKWVLPLWLQGSSFQQDLLARLPPPSKLFEAITGSQGQLVLPALLGFTKGIGSLVEAVIVILFLSLYWSINQIHFERLWLSLLPSGQRKQARGIWRTIEYEVGSYTRGQLIQSLLAGLLLGLGYWALGSPYPALLGLVGALACLIPVVGAVLVVIPVLLMGLLTSVQLSLITTLYAVVILIVLGIWVKPRLFTRRWDNPILTLVLLIFLATAFGLIGIIVAPLLSVICQILWSRLVSRRAVSGAAAQISDLKERQSMLWAEIKEMGEPPLPLVTSSMERLTHLMEKAEPILQAGIPAEPSTSFLSPLPDTAEGEPPISIKPSKTDDDILQGG